MVMKMSVVVFWVVTLCSLEGGYHCFNSMFRVALTYMLKMKARDFSEILETTYRTTQCHTQMTMVIFRY
jgi:hypothetical protein